MHAYVRRKEDGSIDFNALQLDITEILDKEGIHNTTILDVHTGSGYKRTLGGVLIELEKCISHYTGLPYTKKALLLIDLVGKKVIGGTVPNSFTTQIYMGPHKGIMCNSSDYSQSSFYDSYMLLVWETFTSKLEPPINKHKLDEENLTPYDKFIRKVVHLSDLYNTLVSYDGLGYYVRQYVDTYGSYMDEFKHMKERVKVELDEILNNYPPEFIDVKE